MYISLSGGTVSAFRFCDWMLRYCTYNLIKLGEVRFASEFVLKFLVRHKQAIAIQQVLYKQNIVVTPFTAEYGLPSNENFFFIE